MNYFIKLPLNDINTDLIANSLNSFIIKFDDSPLELDVCIYRFRIKKSGIIIILKSKDNISDLNDNITITTSQLNSNSNNQDEISNKHIKENSINTKNEQNILFLNNKSLILIEIETNKAPFDDIIAIDKIREKISRKIGKNLDDNYQTYIPTLFLIQDSNIDKCEIINEDRPGIAYIAAIIFVLNLIKIINNSINSKLENKENIKIN